MNETEWGAIMKLFSVCAACAWSPKPYDGKRQWGDFDKCSRCGEMMEVWTESGIRNEEVRRHNYAALSGGEHSDD